MLGLFYVIPFYAIIGGNAEVALYQSGYVIYSIFISISTAGVPLAVSKYIAKYNAIEEYAVGRRLFKTGAVLMMATGIFSFMAMYISAPYLAGFMLDGQKGPYGIDDIATVIRAVSWALIIIPFMSLVRGFFQGHQSMGPSAVSQVVEQIARIAFLLSAAYIVMFVVKGSPVTAVSFATFAAFIGGLASLFVLLLYWKKRKAGLDALLEHDRGQVSVSLPSMYKEIFIYALPFVLVGIANPMYQFIDQLTFSKGMAAYGEASEAFEKIGVLTMTTHKLVIIPVSLATAFAMALVPLVTESFTKGHRKAMVRQLDQIFQVLLFLTVPAAIGLSLLAEPFYTVFYGESEFGAQILRTYAPVAILFALYSVTAAVLQGIDEQRFTVLSLLTGLLVKLAFNIPLIKVFGTEGAVYATSLGYTVSIIINIIVIKVFAQYPFKMVARRTILIGLFNAFMAAAVYVSYRGLAHLLNPEQRGTALILIIVCAFIGAAVYAYLALRTRLADKLFGDRLAKVRARLGFTK